MEQEIFLTSKNKMEKAVEHYNQEVSFIRTGRASTQILNPVKVDYYGVPTPLNNVANITIPEAQLISIQPFDPSTIELIEKAIVESDIGLTPSNDGNIIRLNIPSLTDERRKELVRQVHKIIEDGKIAVRNIRRDAIHKVHDYGKEENISEDEIKGRETELQTITDSHIKELETQQHNKEKDLMKV